jgi:hypothetical protein
MVNTFLNKGSTSLLKDGWSWLEPHRPLRKGSCHTESSRLSSRNFGPAEMFLIIYLINRITGTPRRWACIVYPYCNISRSRKQPRCDQQMRPAMSSCLRSSWLRIGDMVGIILASRLQAFRDPLSIFCSRGVFPISLTEAEEPQKPRQFISIRKCQSGRKSNYDPAA